VNVGKGIFLMGDNWIGGHSVICDDVTLGKGVVVGANSTVLTSVPMATVVAGSPARIIKKRHSGSWEFHKVERASKDEMPAEILEYVEKRGGAISNHVASYDLILEVGCGEGIVTSILAKIAPNIIGCDYSEDGLKIARKINPGIEFIFSSSTNLRFEDARFTKVVLSDVAEHLLPNQFIRTLEEIGRVLKTNGELVLTTPLTGRGRETSTYAHIYEYSEKEMIMILERYFRKVTLRDGAYGLFRAMK
jgi:SAM-dependent methyltransferase